MRHRDKSFPAIYVMVVLAHVGAIAWVLLGARGCQQSLVASTPAKDSAKEKSAVRLNLALPQSVAESLPPANGYSPSGDGRGMQARADSEGEDPASRLTLPASNQPDAAATPEPAPSAVREVPREKLDLVEREKQAQEEAEAEARRKDVLRQAEEARNKEQELAAKEEERKLALKQQADRNAAAQTERQLAERQAELDRETEEIARLEEKERKLAQEREAERKAAEALRQRKLFERRERERQQQEAANKKKEEERKFALKQEAERKAAAEAAERQRQLAEQREEERRAAEETERQRQLAEQREEERRAAEETERQRQLAEQREEERRAAEETERQRQLAEQREGEDAKRIEKARVVTSVVPVSPAVVKPNVVAAGEGGNGSSPEVVAAKPRSGGSAEAGVLDMGAYRATVQKMIQSRWTIPAGIAVESYPEVLVRINRAGKVVFARNERSSGVPELDRSAINAVRIGSELIPLPAGYDKDFYEVTVKFQVD